MTMVTLQNQFKFSDNKRPVIYGIPEKLRNKTDHGVPNARVWWEEPTASDNSGSFKMTSTHRPGDSFPIGLTNVTYIAVDPSNNTANSTFTIEVVGKLIQNRIQTR